MENGHAQLWSDTIDKDFWTIFFQLLILSDDVFPILKTEREN